MVKVIYRSNVCKKKRKSVDRKDIRDKLSAKFKNPILKKRKTP